MSYVTGYRLPVAVTKCCRLHVAGFHPGVLGLLTEHLLPTANPALLTFFAGCGFSFFVLPLP